MSGEEVGYMGALAFSYAGVIAFVQLLWMPPESVALSILIGVACSAVAAVSTMAARWLR